jgi:hypothetical protein
MGSVFHSLVFGGRHPRPNHKPLGYPHLRAFILAHANDTNITG